MIETINVFLTVISAIQCHPNFVRTAKKMPGNAPEGH